MSWTMRKYPQKPSRAIMSISFSSRFPGPGVLGAGAVAAQTAVGDEFAQVLLGLPVIGHRSARQVGTRGLEGEGAVRADPRRGLKRLGGEACGHLLP